MSNYAEVMARCIEDCQVVRMDDGNVFAADGYGWYFVYYDGVAEKVNKSLLSRKVLGETAEFRKQLLKMADPMETFLVGKNEKLIKELIRLRRIGRNFHPHARYTQIGGGVDAYVLRGGSRALLEESSTAIFVSRRIVCNAAVLAGRIPSSWWYWEWRLVGKGIENGIAAWIFGRGVKPSIIMPLHIPWEVQR